MSTRYSETFAKQIAPIMGKPAFVHTANALMEVGLNRENIFVETTEPDIRQSKVIGTGIELYAGKEHIKIIKHKQMPDVDVILEVAKKAAERKKEFVMILYADALYPIKFLKETLRAASQTLPTENDSALMGITTCLDRADEYYLETRKDNSVESISDEKRIKNTDLLFATIVLRTKNMLELEIQKGVKRQQVGALYIAKQLINSGKKVYANKTTDLPPYLHYNDISAYHRVITFIENKPKKYIHDEYGI